MADDSLYSLLIKVQGGDEAAAEIIKSRYALRQVGDESARLGEKFQEPIQHVGLMSFAHQAFGSIGLGRELYPIVTMLNAGMTELGAAAGLAGGPMGILIAALTAVAGVTSLVIEHNRQHSETLDQLAQKQASALATTDNLKKALEDYRKEVGELPVGLKALAEATASLDAAQRQQLEHTKGEQMAAAQQQIAANEAQIQKIRESIDANSQLTEAMVQQGVTQRDLDRDRQQALQEVDRLKDANKGLQQQYEALKKDIPAIAQGFSGVEDRLKQTAEAHKVAAKAAQEHAEQEKKASDEIRKAAREEKEELDRDAKTIEAGRQSLSDKTKELSDQDAEITRSAHDKEIAAARKSHDQQIAEIEKLYAEKKALAEKDGMDTAALDQQRDLAVAASDKLMVDRIKGANSDLVTNFKRVAEAMQDDFDHAFARVLMGHTNMKQQIIAVERQIEEQLLADTVKMAVDYTVSAARKIIADKAVAASSATTSGQQIVQNAAVSKSIDLQTASVVALSGALKEANIQAIALSATMKTIVVP